MLIAFSGLPGVGKSTVGLAAAKRLRAAYLRIDTIEQAARSANVLDASKGVGPAGYLIAYRVAADNLLLGLTVIADSVNPLRVTRDSYRDVAMSTRTVCLDVEIICSNITMHQDRVEMRRPTVDGLRLPLWQDVLNREYEAWDRTPLRLDTAVLSADECAEQIADAVSAATV